MPAPLRILIVDDAAIYRKLVSDAIRSLPDVEIVGTAANGLLALDKIRDLRPDLVTLDLEMPELDGVQVLRRLRAADASVGVIMLSSFTSANASATTEALSLGAFDFVLKPSSADRAANQADLSGELATKIAAFGRRRRIKPYAEPGVVLGPTPDSGVSESREHAPPAVVCVGISTGGPEALGRMLPQLPEDLAVPVFVVQHMPPLFTKSLADDLNRKCKLLVSEGVDGQCVGPGDIVIAPGGRQMGFERRGKQFVVRLSDDPPENSCRPAVDYLFRCAARVCKSAVLAVIMTGMGSDGAKGIRELKRLGASVVAQDEATCVVFGMPLFPIQEGLVDVVAPLSRIAEEITRLAGRKEAVCR